MAINRRQFLKGLAVGSASAAATATGADEAEALQRAPLTRPAEAVGLLYDSTLCVGCKACVAGCKAANDMPAEIPERLGDWNEGTWDSATDLSGRTLNVIKLYRNGTAEQKDREDNGYAFIKRQCLHCVDASCVSACPVTAMIKNPVTGVVSHDPDRCIGCRYCVYACPFQVPKYNFEGPFGKIEKCQLCNHLLAEGKLPGCVDSCPTGATLFGRFEDLDKEARRRIELKPGDTYSYPRGDINGKFGPEMPPNEKVIEAAYLPEVYGEKILGGTQALYVSAVPFDKLGLPYGNVPDHAYATETEGVQHFLYTGMIMPAAVLSALVLIARRNVDRHHHEAEDDADEGRSA